VGPHSAKLPPGSNLSYSGTPPASSFPSSTTYSVQSRVIFSAVVQVRSQVSRFERTKYPCGYRPAVAYRTSIGNVNDFHAFFWATATSWKPCRRVNTKPVELAVLFTVCASFKGVCTEVLTLNFAAYIFAGIYAGNYAKLWQLIQGVWDAKLIENHCFGQKNTLCISIINTITFSLLLQWTSYNGIPETKLRWTEVF